MNPRAIARDVLIIWGLTFCGGFVIGVALGKNGLGTPRAMIAVALSNFLLSVVGFCIAGVLERAQRLPHLAVVALACWLLSAMNLAWNPAFKVSNWLVSSVFVLAAMGVGAGLSLAFAPSRQGEDEAHR